MNILKIHIAIVFIIMLLQTPTEGQKIVINEVQYKNTNTLYDSQENTPDWIELYNYGENVEHLNGFQLSDDKDQTDRWTFPEIEIQPHEYLVIYASGEDKITEGEIHTDFRLGVMADPLFLINDKGEVIDSMEVQCVPPDKTLGCLPDGCQSKVVQIPSPGRSNNNSETVKVNFKPDTLIISHQSGFYSSGIQIQLKNQYKENDIVYTLDADDLDFDSPLYTNSIYLDDISNNKNRFANKVEQSYEPGNLISKANILRACVYSEGCPASNEISNTYFISNASAFDYHVPVVSLTTDKDNLFDDDIGIYTKGNHDNCNQHGKKWERHAHLVIFDSNQNMIINQGAGIRVHGNGSRTAPQKSLRVYAREEYGADSFNYPFFSQKPNLDSFKTLLLRRVKDWSETMIKDELCQYLVQDMNIDYTATETIVLFINGEYWGIYNLRERQDEYYISNNYGIQNPELDIIGHEKTNITVESGDAVAYNELIGTIENSDLESPEFFQAISEKMDIDALTDFYTAQLYFANTDFPNRNLELWRLRNDTSKWRYFFFDLDAAMIRVNYNHLSEYNNTCEELHKYGEYSTQVLRSLLQNKEYRTLFNSKFNYHLSNTFSTEKVISAINLYEKLYKTLILEHIYRWEDPEDYNKWLHNVQVLRSFAVQRPAFLHEQLFNNFGNPFLVYPNPSNGNFYIDFFTGNSAQKELYIIDINGRTVYRETLLSGEQEFLETTLNRGLYILKIEMENSGYAQKIQILK